IGQEVSHEDLGGAEMHAQISGTIDFREPDDAATIKRLQELAKVMPHDGPAAPYRREEATEPARPATDIYDIVSVDGRKQFDVKEVIDCIVDGESFQEYKPEFGQSLVCGYARIGGFPVGIVANQRQQVKTPNRGLQFAGVIYDDSAEKAARFIMDCNQNWVPIVFLQDVMGFMVGRDSEQGGIIKAGAKLVNVLSNCRVPKLTIITGGSYGAGNYALCGKAFDPRFIFAWPNARYAVMGGKQAASTLLDINIRAMKRAGQEPDAEELEALRKKVTDGYENTTDIRYGASRGWVDGIIEPTETRSALICMLECATKHADDKPFTTGVLQT
ncbi:MAG: carboxyl transferase domain-containing protein, partial [Planctomycetota bacterium]